MGLWVFHLMWRLGVPENLMICKCPVQVIKLHQIEMNYLPVHGNAAGGSVDSVVMQSFSPLKHLLEPR